MRDFFSSRGMSTKENGPKTRNFSNFMKKDINIKNMLTTYKQKLEQKFPEPKKG
jgi:hypothetical protein